MQKAFIQKDDFTIIRLKLVPGSSIDKVCGYLGERLKIKIKGMPENGQANQYLLKYLAKILNININSLSLIRGDCSNNKDILVNLKISDVTERLRID